MTPEEEAEKFAQVAKNLKVVADRLVADHPELPMREFGRAFIAVAVALILEAAGPRDTAEDLRAWADRICPPEGAAKPGRAN